LEEKKREEEERKKPENIEAAAVSKLKLIKVLIAEGKTDVAKLRLKQMIGAYPNTKAAEEAMELLEKLEN